MMVRNGPLTAKMLRGRFAGRYISARWPVLSFVLGYEEHGR